MKLVSDKIKQLDRIIALTHQNNSITNAVRWKWAIDKKREILEAQKMAIKTQIENITDLQEWVELLPQHNDFGECQDDWNNIIKRKVLFLKLEKVNKMLSVTPIN